MNWCQRHKLRTDSRRNLKVNPTAFFKLTGRDDVRLRELTLAALDFPDEFRRNLWFTTVDALAIADDTSQLSSRCWLWLKDARLFLNDLQRATAHMPKGLGRAAVERRLLAAVLGKLPRYTLLPPPAHRH